MLFISFCLYCFALTFWVEIKVYSYQEKKKRQLSGNQVEDCRSVSWNQVKDRRSWLTSPDWYHFFRLIAEGWVEIRSKTPSLSLPHLHISINLLSTCIPRKPQQSFFFFWPRGHHEKCLLKKKTVFLKKKCLYYIERDKVQLFFKPEHIFSFEPNTWKTIHFTFLEAQTVPQFRGGNVPSYFRIIVECLTISE